MKKRVLSMLLCAMICLAGCGNTAQQNVTTEDDKQVQEEQQETVDEDAVTSDETGLESQPDSESSAADDVDEPEYELPETVTAKVTMAEPFNNTRIKWACTGLKEYKELGSDKYTDIPEEGYVYLVLFVDIENYSLVDTYISGNGFTAEVDGVELPKAAMYNDPEGYPTIFKEIPAGFGLEGCVIWQVPEDWNTVTYHYTGFEDEFYTILDGEVTSKDLKDPTPYNQPAL